MTFIGKLREAAHKARETHPAKLWPTRSIWHDRSDQPEHIQLIDLLMDIRNLLFLIVLLILFL